MQMWIASAALIASLLIANWWQYQKHEEYVSRTSEQIANLQSANRDMNEQVQRMVDEKHQTQIELLELGNVKADLERQLSEKSKEFDGYKSRQNVVLTKTTLVEKRVNQAIDKRTEEIACVTNDTQACVKIGKVTADQGGRPL